MCPVDPLQRTCTELLPNEDTGAAWSSQDPAPVITVRELAQVPVFVLLGEPGMGKSETMKALATLVLGEQGKPIAANDFIVLPAPLHNADHPVFIDALDEARAGGDTTVWRELRRNIAHSGLTHFGVACRVADWQGTDAQDLATVVQGQRIRIFALNPLTHDQCHAVLKNEDIEDPDGFEQQAQALGFSDMLGNPQSLKLLVAAVKKNQGQWPETRRDAYELACQELVREPNQRLLQAQKSAAKLGEENLLDAAGWLCALMLLSNQNEVADETLGIGVFASVRLPEVLDAIPANGFSTDAIHQVLKRRLFSKPTGYVAAHRTVAEYLAARHIAKRIAHGGLLPSRVSALMLASSKYLVGNLRGLAGWLAALSEPMRPPIFEADPAAVLDYGDLYLLSQPAKQALIEQLSVHPRTGNLSNVWQKSALYVPLVQSDMRGFVTTWFSTYQSERPTSSSQTTVAYVLLNALHHVPRDEWWVACLLGLIRVESVYIGVRDSALDALIVHAPPIETIALLEELQTGALQDRDGRLIGSLLQHLYPEHVKPAQVLRFLRTSVSVRQSSEIQWFWDHYLEKLTPPELLPEFMDAMLHTFSPKVVAELSDEPSGQRLAGLATLTVGAITLYGNVTPIEKLASWIKLISDSENLPFGHLAPALAKQLGQWMAEHPVEVKEVLAHWIVKDDPCWVAEHRVLDIFRPTGLGRFWLDQATKWDAIQDSTKAEDCLRTAFRWVDQEGSGIALEDLEHVASHSNTLQQALAPQLMSFLDEENKRRKRWFLDQKRREAHAAKQDVNEKNRLYLLNHLDEVRQGAPLEYLNRAAWADLKDHGYLSWHDNEPLEQWREAHPELDAATRKGYQTLLGQLTAAQADAVVSARKKGESFHIELPCLLAAHQLFSEQPDRFFKLGEERLKALVTLHLLNHSGHHGWFLALTERHPDWVEGTWWDLSKRQLRSKKDIRIPQMGLLRHELTGTAIAARLLSQVLEAWPSKFNELNFAEFTTVLEAVLRQCPAAEVSRLIQGRLKRKSLGSLQKAYLLMAGLWVDHAVFAPQLQQGLSKKQIVQTELLGFIGHLRRYGGESKPLPNWDTRTLDMLFRLFAPLCSPEYPVGAYSPDAKDAGRGFLYQVLTSLRDDTSEAARQVLATLITEPSLSEWKSPLEEAASRQAQASAEKSFVVPTPRQVALSLHNKAPANPSDLMAVALDALADLQREIRNSPSNLINNFWTVDKNGKLPQPPHRPENTCRDVIAQWFSPRLAAMSVTVLPELQHGDQKRSDLGLLVHNVGAPEMLLPIEVKGDWHTALWTAAHQQLGQQYASDSRCLNQGIYLVLWMGDLTGLKQQPNYKSKVTTAQELQLQLQQQEDERGGLVKIRVVVLDLSIPTR